MEEKKTDSSIQSAIVVGLTVIAVLAIYRKGVKHGYRDAMTVVNDVCESAAKALEIGKF